MASLNTLISFFLWKIYDGITSAAFKGLPALIQPKNSPYLNQVNVLLEVNMLRDLCGWFFVNS